MDSIRGKINIKKLSAELRYLAAIITAKKRYVKGGWAPKDLAQKETHRFNRLCLLRALHRGRQHWAHLDLDSTYDEIKDLIPEFHREQVEPTEHEKKELREARFSRKLRKLARSQRHLSRVYSSAAEHQGG